MSDLVASLRLRFEDPASFDEGDIFMDELARDAADCIEELEAERDRLRDYASAASKALTGLTPGGSEYFSGKIGDLYVADIPLCVAHIRKRYETAMTHLVKATAAEAALEKAKEALRWYEDQMCEHSRHSELCGNLDENDCGGCRARAALAAMEAARLSSSGREE